MVRPEFISAASEAETMHDIITILNDEVVSYEEQIKIKINKFSSNFISFNAVHVRRQFKPTQFNRWIKNHGMNVLLPPGIVDDTKVDNIICKLQSVDPNIWTLYSQNQFLKLMQTNRV